MRGEIQHKLVNLIRLSDRSVKRSIEKRVEGTGVYRSQHRLLMNLGRNPECSQTELAEKLEISPAAVAVSLKKLEKAGYIIRQSKESDNRINHIAVTQKGRETIDVSICYFKELELALFQDFTEEEMKTLETLLGKVIDNGEKYYRQMLPAGENNSIGKADEKR